MIPFANRRPALAAILLSGALALGGCGPKPPAAVSATPATAAPFDQAAEVDGAVALLDKGDVDGARARIDALLAHDPNDAAAKVLKDSIEQDAKALLGPKSFAYKTKPGETMLDLSGRFLGNRLKFFELARYNGIAVPDALAPGTVLRIPGAATRSAADKSGARKPVATKPRAAAPVASALPGAPAPAAGAAKADPAAAQAARAAGLAALAQGNVDRAVGLLRRAAALDPANPLVRRDLDRAERISRTVKARK